MKWSSFSSLNIIFGLFYDFFSIQEYTPPKILPVYDPHLNKPCCQKQQGMGHQFLLCKGRAACSTTFILATAKPT